MLLTDLLKKSLSDTIKLEAKRLGFFDCGIAEVIFLNQDAQRMEQWLAEGAHGEMKYLENNKDKRYNPALLLENARSVITVLFNYFPHNSLSNDQTYTVSKYAYGKDYHFVMKKKLNELLTFIEAKTGERTGRAFVDSAPFLDRAWAQRSGLGFIGKNTCLINKKGGSFFFIGHLLIDLDLFYDAIPDPKSYCGHCTRCIDACPTKAITPFKVDARKCISYLTIEYRGALDSGFKETFNDRIYGCDTCQDVCPWNRFSSPHNEPEFMPTEKLREMTKSDWESMDKPLFNQLFKHSAVQRAGFKGLRRNIDFLSNSTNFED